MNLKERYDQLLRDNGIPEGEDRSRIYSLIENGLAEFCSSCERPAIWCDGEHTRMLMVDFIFEMKNVKYIVDKKAIGSESGFEIIRPENIEEIAIDGIIISSLMYRNEIKKEIEREHREIRYFDLYDLLEENGIHVWTEYYRGSHPYSFYGTIGTLRMQMMDVTSGDVAENILRDIVTQLIYIKDFQHAEYYAFQLRKLNSQYNSLYEDIQNLYQEELKCLDEIDANNVLMLCLDGMRSKDFVGDSFPNTKKEIMRKGTFFNRAYSVSTSTYESLIPCFSENYDLRTEYYKSNVLPKNHVRFIKKAHEQERNIYFYTDISDFVDDKKIKRSRIPETASEKIWKFILDAKGEKNGLFYIHILYETHFSYPGIYGTERLITDGMSVMFDYLGRMGGKIRADYRLQHAEMCRYMDEILAPFVEHIKLPAVIFADHGNDIPAMNKKLEDLNETVFSCSEEWIRIPMAIIQNGREQAIDYDLMSLSELNKILVCLMEGKNYSHPKMNYVKVQRSELYNPDFQYLYKQADKEKELLAFECFVIEDGYKLVVFSDGTKKLYRTKDDEKIDDGVFVERIFKMIYPKVTVI